MGAALGLGLRPGDAVISIGTSGTVYAVSDTPTSDASGAVAGFADATGRFLPLVCTSNATKVTEAIRRLLGVDHATFDQLALMSEPGAGGLTLLPYLDGERTPNRPDASGVLSGMRSDVSRSQLARAAFEGVICSLLDAFDALLATGIPTPERVLLVGGGAQSAAYSTLLGSYCSIPVEVPAVDEAVASGACVQAAATLTGEAQAEIAAAWGLTATRPVEEVGELVRAAPEVRAAYATLRDA
jgi:xylulokinase